MTRKDEKPKAASLPRPLDQRAASNLASQAWEATSPEEQAEAADLQIDGIHSDDGSGTQAGDKTTTARRGSSRPQK